MAVLEVEIEGAVSFDHGPYMRVSVILWTYHPIRTQRTYTRDYILRDTPKERAIRRTING